MKWATPINLNWLRYTEKPIFPTTKTCSSCPSNEKGSLAVMDFACCYTEKPYAGIQMDRASTITGRWGQTQA